MNKEMNKEQLKQIAQTLPPPVHDWLKTQWQINKHHPPLGMTNWAKLRRLRPIAKCFGFERGLPIDRYYIENFLARQADDIQGHVLEIKEPLYTYRFGGDRVTKSDVLHVVEGDSEATIVGDLTNAHKISSEAFDCVIMIPQWFDLFTPRFLASRVFNSFFNPELLRKQFPRFRLFLKLLRREDWPLQKDHIRIQESEIQNWAAQNLEITLRVWIN